MSQESHYWEDFCMHCRSAIKLSPNFNPERSVAAGGGVCVVEGCPGYVGHAPSDQRIGNKSPALMVDVATSLAEQAMFSNNHHHDDLEDVSSDDTPLLFEDRNLSSSNVSREEMNIFDHCHSSSGNNDAEREITRKKVQQKLILAICFCLIFVCGEFIGGYVANSLAILTDASHMFSDFINLGIALIATRMTFKPRTRNFNWAFHRVEALGALATVVLIWDLAAYLAIQSIHRISSGQVEVQSTPMLIIAAVAFFFNIFLIFFFRGLNLPHGHSHGGGGGGHSHFVNSIAENEIESNNNGNVAESGHEVRNHLNLRAATIHVLGDVITSFGVLVASVIIYFFPNLKLLDPICSLILCFVVVFTTISVTRDSVRILLEAKPKHIDYEIVHTELKSGVEGVQDVHDLRIWSLTSDRSVLSVHLAVGKNANREKILFAALKLLKEKFEISDAIIQIELHKINVSTSCNNCNELKPRAEGRNL